MSEKLKPCPFCGGKATMEKHEYGVIELGCDNVGCIVLPSAKHLSEEAAAKAWNRRHQDQDTSSEFERMMK